ncbi:4'-phosphopantetheinyl transferase superfamily protein [Algoriphagus sp. AK58]|uniref:4'-phosphopantetheinyl transferase family protein n=1 Tax=Algoriphagus sp. AK58 TaxID=1406877 RepID=UPI00164F1543|nr:4'-phosphopantetheinyl transferase superfamily protein [Algoriphagus sp. AK58]MBC6367514.1 hypothetical protein [Algoriphagus sp. AK58]
MLYLSYTRILEPFSSQVFEDYLVQLPATMQSKVVQYRRWQDSHTALMGKIILKEMACTYYKIPDILHQISYSPTKKPEVSGSLSFNISHSENLVVCIIGEGQGLGVDVEKVTKVNFTDFQDYMSATEWNQIQLAKDPNHAFLNYWTQIEAAVKADGRGLNIPLKEVNIQNSMVTIGSSSWFTLEVNLIEGYTCHIATSDRLTSDELACFNYENLKPF